MDVAPAFAADAMLGSLARWLRLFGFDCTFDVHIEDARLIETARAEARVVLTRDRAVARKAARAIFVESDDVDAQLLSVFRRLGVSLPAEIPMTRCSLCNALLEPATEAMVDGAALPARVLESHTEFYRCPKCARFYWKGTHFESMGRRLAGLRERRGAASAPSEPLGPREPAARNR